jgi:hypothetical protein
MSRRSRGLGLTAMVARDNTPDHSTTLPLYHHYQSTRPYSSTTLECICNAHSTLATPPQGVSPLADPRISVDEGQTNWQGPGISTPEFDEKYRDLCSGEKV